MLNIDYTLLCRQKEALVTMASDTLRPAEELEVLRGVIHLLDAVQDFMVDEGFADSTEVFKRPPAGLAGK